MKRKPGTFWAPAAAGFGVMYLAIMGLSTFFVKENLVEDYRQRFKEAAISIVRKVSEKEFAMETEEWKEEERKDFYQALANEAFWEADSERLEISVGVYDKKKHLFAKSQEQAGNNSARISGTEWQKYASFGLDDFLSLKEKEELAAWQWEDIRSFDLTLPDKLRFSIRVSPDGRDLWGIYVQEITWKENPNEEELAFRNPLTGGGYMQDSGVTVDYGTGEELSEGKTFYETGSRMVWQWENSRIREEELENGKIFDTSMTFPYMGIYEKGSYDRWHQWSRSPYLHGYPEVQEFVWEPGTEEPPIVTDEDGFWHRGRYQLQIGMAGDPFVYMEIRMECRPWMDAAGDMKYAYGAGLLLMFACMTAVAWAFRRTYDRQAALEETRRDMTNAMAHELKTPLGVIRNFAENLAEHNREDKRDYYLEQIIRQTEEIDGLVVKMIEISRLDSKELILGREEVSFLELTREQLARLEPVVREKDLQVQYEEKGDFVVTGDREYLAKAVWNLLANAVDYNLPGGRIRVRTEKNSWSIENTAAPMEEDPFLHAFDLFYTGDKNRGRKDGHMGMGLFLTRKILCLHGLQVNIGKSEDGVRVTVNRHKKPFIRQRIS